MTDDESDTQLEWSRYAATRRLHRHGSRMIREAKDRLTGRRVILKTAPQNLARQELRTLLSLPPGVGPAVLDAAWDGRARLVLVLECLAGRTLLDPDLEVPRAHVPSLTHAICCSLAHLHRAGVVHADLKPSNILVVDQERPVVRLLDFGFAFSRSGRFHDGTEEQRGGTPPFLAPEIERGWVVDGRADQYSLGMTLNQLFPGLAEDSAWAPILRKLTAATPAQRYPHILQLRDELGGRFNIMVNARSIPPFGAGPLRERETEIERVVAAIRRSPRARVLIQGRPGTGLTRFLLEAVLAVSSAGGTAVRAIDLSGDDQKVDAAFCSALLAEHGAAGEAVLLGLPDPSPGLSWLDSHRAAWVRELLRQGSWERLELPPLSVGTWVELVAESLGSGGADAEELAQQLHVATGGDLKRSADGFSVLVAASATEDGLNWRLNPADLRAALAAWRPAPPPPRLAHIPPHLQEPLGMLAQVGTPVPRALATRLIARFAASPEYLPQLLNGGYLVAEADERVAIVTDSLRRELYTLPRFPLPELEEWLNDTFAPDRGRPDETIQACLRARRLGDPEKEARWLSAALEAADADRRWSDVQQLLAYPASPPADWSLEWVLGQIDDLGPILAGQWTRERLMLVAATSLRLVDLATCTPLLERVVQGDDPRAALDALVHMLSMAVNRYDPDAYNRYLEALEEREAAGAGASAGILDFYRALFARASGQPQKAEAYALEATRSLRGSGLIYEGFSLQLLAILQFARDPQGAIATMRAALGSAQDREQLAQMRYNLTLMYARQGDLDAAASAADEGIRTLHRKVSEARLVGLRIQRAWAWAELDLTDQAVREARSLLGLTAVRQMPSHLVTVLSLLGYCQLHRSSSWDAITVSARAWREACVGNGAQTKLSIMAIRYLLDALLDLNAWETVRAYGATIQMTSGDRQDPADITVAARARAILAQAEGRTAEAVDLLARHEVDARGLSEVVKAARYLHHLALARLAGAREAEDAAQAEAAARLLSDELEQLKGPGYGYYRARALLSLSTAQAWLGEHRNAAESLGEAVTLARRIRSLGLLAQCLEAQALESLNGAGQRTDPRSGRRLPKGDARKRR